MPHRAKHGGEPRDQRGFTFVEIAIVLVIIGTLLGGVLKGQELIASARVRNIIAQHEGIKAAFFGFQDRFRAVPGDFVFASRTLSCQAGTVCLNGNGNGVIEAGGVPIMSGGVATEGREDLLAWMHLSSAGFLNGSYVMVAGEPGATDANSPKNVFNIYLQLVYDATYADIGAVANKHNLKTGSRIPVEMIAEVDRKIDDGNGLRGAFRYSSYFGNGSTAPPVPSPVYAPGQCVATAGVWYVSQGEVNCGGASLL